MTQETDSFVQEVDESLRQDRMLTLAKRFGPWLIGAFVLLLVGVLGWQMWRDNELKSARAHADQYAAAQEMARGGNLDGAKTEFERLSREGPQNYRVMAQLEHAAILETQGDLQAALTEFDAAANAAQDPVMRDTARLRAAYIAADSEDFPTLQRRLQPLIDSESRLRFLASELLGVEAWEAGQTDLARETLQNLTLAFDAPDAVKERAQIALNVIGPAPAAAAAPAAPAGGAQTAPAPAEGETK